MPELLVEKCFKRAHIVRNGTNYYIQLIRYQPSDYAVLIRYESISFSSITNSSKAFHVGNEASGRHVTPRH